MSRMPTFRRWFTRCFIEASNRPGLYAIHNTSPKSLIFHPTLQTLVCIHFIFIDYVNSYLLCKYVCWLISASGMKGITSKPTISLVPKIMSYDYKPAKVDPRSTLSPTAWKVKVNTSTNLDLQWPPNHPYLPPFPYTVATTYILPSFLTHIIFYHSTTTPPIFLDY